MATDGHMRWLQPSNENSPSVRTNWLDTLADLVTVYPIQEIIDAFDTAKENAAPLPWLTCHQCRRKEMGLLRYMRFTIPESSLGNGTKR